MKSLILAVMAAFGCASSVAAQTLTACSCEVAKSVCLSDSEMSEHAVHVEMAPANWVDAELTELEAYIVNSIDHIGWYAYLWFPVVARGTLNFGANDREEDVHATIVSLIERGGLVFKQESLEDNPPGWYPAPGLVKATERKMREIMSRLPPPLPDRFSERFHIIAHGDKFDVDAFIATSSLRPDFVWRRGPSGTSGIELFFGDGRQIGLFDQEDVAVTYLNTHKEELKALARFPGVDTFILGLVWICTPEQFVFSVGPSAELMQLALDIGIFPLYYCTIDGRGAPHLRNDCR